MKRFLWIAILCALLGVAGHKIFPDWYGWLTSTGALALRVGPLFAWRLILRILRRWVLRYLFRFLPYPIKRLCLWIDAVVRARCGAYWDRLRTYWRESWVRRFVVLVPIMVICVAFAYKLEGWAEYFSLFPIPFLFTAIFPQGFVMLSIEYAAYYLTLWGHGAAVDWVVAHIPHRHVKIVRGHGRKATVFLGKWTRPARLGGTSLLRRWRRSH